MTFTGIIEVCPPTFFVLNYVYVFCVGFDELFQMHPVHERIYACALN